MNIRYLLETNFSPSNEGFIDKVKAIFGKTSKSSESSSNEDKGYNQWVIDVLLRKDPNSHELNDGDIVVPKTRGGFFVRNGRTVDNVLAEFTKDFKEYQRLFNTAKPILVAYGRYINRVEKELDVFTGDVDRPEEFMAKVQQLVKQAPKNLIDNFREPSFSFLGFSGVKFVVNGEFPHETKPNSDREVVIQPPSAKELPALVKLIRDILNLITDIHELYNYDLPIPLDPTDPPFRGYSDLLWDGKTQGYYPFFFSPYDEHNSNFLDLMEKRLIYLENALGRYLKLAIKPS